MLKILHRIHVHVLVLQVLILVNEERLCIKKIMHGKLVLTKNISHSMVYQDLLTARFCTLVFKGKCSFHFSEARMISLQP